MDTVFLYHKMNIETLPHDVFTVISIYLDTYDANNLRMTNNFFNKEVENLRFSKPYYIEDKNGYCKILIRNTEIIGKSLDSLITINKFYIKSDEAHISLEVCKKKFKDQYVLYMYDSHGGYPYFFEDKVEVKSIIESYNAFKIGLSNQKELEKIITRRKSNQNKSLEEVGLKKNYY